MLCVDQDRDADVREKRCGRVVFRPLAFIQHHGHGYPSAMGGHEGLRNGGRGKTIGRHRHACEVPVLRPSPSRLRPQKSLTKYAGEAINIFIAQPLGLGARLTLDPTPWNSPPLRHFQERIQRCHST